MAAVGSNVPLTSLMLNLFIGMSLGSNVVIANAIGRNDQNMVKRAVHTSILMALVGFVVIALGEIFAEPMLAALNVPAETMPLASLYLRVFLLSMPSILLYNFEAAIFRSVGITRMPLQALAVSTVLNIGTDLIFVPVLHWGVAGVAIATAIAYTVSAATLFIRLLKTDSVVRVTRATRLSTLSPSSASSRSACPPASKAPSLPSPTSSSSLPSTVWAPRSWPHRAPP